MRQRAQVLAENISKWGHPRCIVTSNYPADFTPLGPLFDLILVDAPCSGEGMFRKDEVAVAEWSPENVEVCWKRQRDILTDIWPTLRPGGLLIYSTCTFNTQEDEENVRWMMDELGAELLPISIDDSWGITPSLVPDVPHAYRFLPGRTRGEGFFLAVVRKGEGASVADAPRGGKGKKKDKKGKQPAIAVPTECKQWLADSSSYTYKVIGTEVMALPSDMEPLYAALSEQLHLIKAGITLAELKGRDALPAHDLAMSTALRADAFARCELAYDEALRYLRREAITLPVDTPRGFVLVTYRNAPLGFVKNLGNRANNLYPNEWRIRSGYLPEAEVQVVPPSCRL
jgi:NOL1/NOP2/fmu family ribosome biogenesis protein